MKIAIVASPFASVPPIKYGGSERVIYYLIKGLIEKGHEPILLGTGDSDVDCDLIPIVRRAIFFPSDLKNIALFNRRVRLIEKRTERKLKMLLPEIDVIHSHKFDLKGFGSFPSLTTLHDPFVLDRPKYINNFPLTYYKERKKLNYVAISHSQQASYPDLNYAGVVYNGEDPSEFPIVLKPNNYVCFVGRFDREKNPHLAIQLAVSQGIHIKLVGKSDYGSRSYFNEEIKPYLDHPLVEFLGELDRSETIKVLSKAKCNLHPTGYREPFGLTVMEAGYCGTPTLAIAKGSMSELIEDNKTGILVEDFVQGYHVLKKCFSLDREYIATKTRKRFNYHKMTQDYIHAYRRVIKTSK
ncbi:glycosyltransferase family 4 protein [Candidatus Saccharibacteria bacterium]|nr:glycosyltransferase family 4 protein [Candidatus Saccharibacteria bacterium]